MSEKLNNAKEIRAERKPLYSKLVKLFWVLSILGIIGVVAVGVLGYLAYNQFIQAPKESNAANEMYYPQQYFDQALNNATAKDSLYNLALNGGEGKYGFLDIIDEYPGTKAANLANYSAGMAYLNMQKYQEAISHLEGFTSSDAILGALAKGGSTTVDIDLKIDATFQGDIIFNTAEIIGGTNALGLTDEDGDLAVLDGSPDDNSEEYQNFQFVGKHQGKDVIYDAAIYTLKMLHNSEVFEMAQHKAAQKFPEYKRIAYEEDENGDIEPLGDNEEEIGLFIAEVMEELEEEEAIKVQEHVEIDDKLDFGIGVDASLNVVEVNDEVIRKFVAEFNDDTLKLDPRHYSFQLDEDD